MPGLRDAARDLLRASVDDALAPRRGLLDGPAASLAALASAIDAVSARAAAAERAAAALTRELSLWSQPFSADLTIQEVLRRHPRAAATLSRHHLPACDGCAVRFDETLAEAAEAYGLDADALVRDLNKLLADG